MTSIESFYMQMPHLAEDESELDLAILAEAIGKERLLNFIDLISSVNILEQPE